MQIVLLTRWISPLIMMISIIALNAKKNANLLRMEKMLSDDLLDIESDVSGKTPGTDLREGVPTLVTLNVMASAKPEDTELKRLLSAPIHDEVVVQQVLRALRTHDGLQQARQQLGNIAKDARTALGPLPLNSATSALFSLCDAVVDRSA